VILRPKPGNPSPPWF
jgi:hypothetical protein